jgi:hypothetical protein
MTVLLTLPIVERAGLVLSASRRIVIYIGYT